MKFTTPCFVRVEDAEKRKEMTEWLKGIGYTVCRCCFFDGWNTLHCGAISEMGGGSWVHGIPDVYTFLPQVAKAHKISIESVHDLAGWNNKMFTKAELMPHQIRIIGIKCERLRDISDEDCINEGIFVNEYVGKGKKCHHYGFDGFFNEAEGWFARGWYNTPREAFARLIDKVSGRGTWASNPWVVVYEFELVK